MRCAGERELALVPAREAEQDGRPAVRAQRHRVVPGHVVSVGAGVGGAAVAERRPGLVRDLDVDLRVLAHAVGLDRLHLQRGQVGVREIDLAQRAERQRQHQVIGDHVCGLVA